MSSKTDVQFHRPMLDRGFSSMQIVHCYNYKKNTDNLRWNTFLYSITTGWSKQIKPLKNGHNRVIKQDRYFFLENIKFSSCVIYASYFSCTVKLNHCFLRDLKNVLKMSPAPFFWTNSRSARSAQICLCSIYRQPISY